MSLGAIATFLLIPPVNLLPAAVAGVAIAWRWKRTGLTIAAIALAGLCVLSTGAAAKYLMMGLERGLDPPAGATPQAIVILAAEMHEGVPGSLVPGFDVGPMTLERLRAGARLARGTGLPVLVSGGEGRADRPSLAEVMGHALRADFGIVPRWLETKSHDTWENAEMSAKLLRADGVTTVYLVTHGWHMRRAMIAFRHAGLTVVPAPERLQPSPDLAEQDFVPAPNMALVSYFAIHEWIGCAVYALRERYPALALHG